MAALSLAALLAAIAASCFLPVNVGFLSITLAFLIGHFGAGMTLSAIAAGFPASLFLTLTGVTLLFAQSQANGTLEQVARRSVRLARGNRGWLPVLFFVLALALAATGVGGIAATALLAPVAMNVAREARVSSFLMAMMLANGGNAGTFSPLAPTGIIARDLMARAGMMGVEWANFTNTLIAQSAVAFAGYLALGGARLIREGAAGASHQESVPPLTPQQKFTLVAVGALLLAVVLFHVDVGAGAFAAAAVLSLTRSSDDGKAMRLMPWGVTIMVCGVTVLMEVVAKTGGMDLFTGLLAGVTSPQWICGVIAAITGVISVYSSSSGVVIPAFLPTIPSLVDKLGGGNPLMIAYSINVGAHLVDVSPLSTLGALCLACAPLEEQADLFRKLMAWGWSMAVVGGVACQLLFGFR
jgi:di/tricarboxylate transporter